MKVLTNESNPNALKIVIASKLAGKPVTVQNVTPKDCYLKRLPQLEVNAGVKLFGTNAAVQFLHPVSSNDLSSVNQWLEWDVTQLQPALVSFGSAGGAQGSAHEARIWSLLKELNSSLKEQQYLIKNSDLSLADVTIWTTLWCTTASTKISETIAKEFVHVHRWLGEIEKVPVVQESLKEYPINRGLKSISQISESTWFPLNSYTGASSTRMNDLNSPLKSKDEVISAEDLAQAKQSWITNNYTDFVEPSYPVLPKKGERNILITSALPYVNNVPHLGNIIGCVLSADIFARYCRQRKYNTVYICGTDEYGTATEAKALEEKMTPQQICDKYFQIHNDIYRWFDIGFDYFGRTSTPDQTEIVQKMFLRIKSQGYVTTKSVDQLLCEKCSRFLADRFVEGTCPNCKYEDARGDQCDGCGHLVNATELINPRCKVCNERPVIKQSTQFFLDLPKIQSKLEDWVSKVQSNWSPIAQTITKPWLRDGLKQRCITRDLKWGIPVPLEGFQDKVFYVWFDAPLGYVSITKKYHKDYQKWWTKSDDYDVDIFQFMAKDNVPFHAIMFPATILAADTGMNMVKHIMATEYLNYEDTKFSKSRGIGVFGDDAQRSEIDADVYRFYLAYIRPETQDSNFNWVDLATKNNSELLNNLGNFVNRALMFCAKNFDSKMPALYLQEDDLTLIALVQKELTSYINLMEQVRMRDALKHVLLISKHGNQYMQSQEPWVKIKGNEDEKKKAGTVIGLSCNVACLLSLLIGPYMPKSARELRRQLGLDKDKQSSAYGYIPTIFSCLLPAGHAIRDPKPLFKKIEDKQVEELRKRHAGRQSSPEAETKKLEQLKINDEKSAPVNGVKSKDVAALEAEIAKQGLLVRTLKATGDETKWKPEVTILLQLKKQLADLTGVVQPPPKKGGKKK